MARTIEVTKKSVTTSQPGLFSITLNLKYLEDAVPLLDQDFSANHWVGQPPSVCAAKIQKAMQTTIDNYKASEAVYNAAALDTAVTNIQNSLTV